jgi:hypothetical protein
VTIPPARTRRRRRERRHRRDPDRAAAPATGKLAIVQVPPSERLPDGIGGPCCAPPR